MVMAGVGAGCVGAQVAGEVGSFGLKGTITGQDGKPVEGAHVYAYKDYSKNLVGVADQVSRGSAADGSYRLEVPPGKYYIVARKRASGSNYGPIVTGDLYDYRFEQEPVTLGRGQVRTMDFKLTALSEPLFFQVFTEQQRTTETGIRGRLFGTDGRPVQGAFATAYNNSDMKRLPDFASTVTDDDGNYTLYLPEGGTWYIGARSHARGVPEPGEPVARYDGSADHSVPVTGGSFIDGIDMTLKPFTSQVPEGYNPY
jgi:hypothetical protein